jgi:tetratricopeptide (TPR) repeat protein
LIWVCATSNSQTQQSQQTLRRIYPDQSKEVSTEALRMAQAGQVDQAIQNVQAALMQCQNTLVGSACWALLNFTQGYLFQQKAQTTQAADREHALNSASAAYQAALKDDPNNAAVHYNLGLLKVASGDTDGGISELRSAAQTDPKQSQYPLKLGDLYVQQKNWQEAMHAYQQAAQAERASDVPPERILELTRRGHGLTPEQLEAQCKEWEKFQPSVAPSCHQQFITMVYANNSAAAESALVAWLDIVARQDRVGTDLIDALPKNWGTPALPPLRSVLRYDLSAIHNDWWQRTIERREAWARFLLAFGQQSIARGPAAVEQILQGALSTVRDDPGSSSSLELERGLALLYVRYPDFDPGQRKLHSLVDQIFEGKMAAIESHDLEAEQRYHTVLGLIFAGQQKWGSENDAYGATYQLKRVVEVADERFQREGIYQPLPEIKELRVKVYEKLGQRNEAEAAGWQLILAYMDSDQLDRAQQSIGALQIQVSQKNAIASLLILRRAATAKRAEQPDGLLTQISALEPKPGVSSEFLQRQQFKAFADVVRTDSTDIDSVKAASQAFSLAVQRHVPLVGIDDFSRWQAVQQRIVNSVGARTEKTQISPGETGASAALKLALPGSTVAQSVEVSPKTTQAAYVVAVIGPEKLIQYGHLISLSDGTFTGPILVLNSPDVRQRLETQGIHVKEVPHSD